MDRVMTLVHIMPTSPNTSQVFSVRFIMGFSSACCCLMTASLLRPLPALLKMFLPILRPGAAEVIDIAGIQERELGGPAIRTIHDRALHAALHERVPCLRVVRAKGELPRRDRVQRP